MNKRIINESQASVGGTIRRTAESKLIVGLLGLAVMILLTTLVVTSITLAQSSTVTVAAGETLEAICEGRRFQMERASRTHIVLSCVADNGPGEPTPLPPQPTNTSEPPPPAEPTNTPPAPPPGGSVEPYAEAPGCEEIGLAHDPQAWHGIWDYEHGCHWDHSHNADPSQLDHIFGPVTNVIHQEISYPWQTMSSHGCLENDCKHEGYKWYVLDTKGQCLQRNVGEDHCVMAARIQYHALGGAHEATVRFHSFWAEAYVCDTAGRCGIVRTGGHSDFGILHCPYKTAHCPLESDPAGEVDLNQPPYRAFTPIELVLTHNHVPNQWNSGTSSAVVRQQFDTYNKLFEYDWTSHDDWGGINVANPGEASHDLNMIHLICPDYQCPYNHSTARFYEIIARIPQELDTDGDGFVTYQGFTDRRGNILSGDCGAWSMDCVPLIIENAPVGAATFRVAVGGLIQDEFFFDFDLSPAGVWWIKYPN